MPRQDKEGPLFFNGIWSVAAMPKAGSMSRVFRLRPLSPPMRSAQRQKD